VKVTVVLLHTAQNKSNDDYVLVDTTHMVLTCRLIYFFWFLDNFSFLLTVLSTMTNLIYVLYLILSAINRACQTVEKTFCNVYKCRKIKKILKTL